MIISYISDNIKSIKHGSFKKDIRRPLACLQAVFVVESLVCVFLCFQQVFWYVGVLGGFGVWNGSESSGAMRSQSRLFQVVEVWHTGPGGPPKAMPVLAPLDAHLLRVGVSLWTAQGRRVPAGLQLPGQRVGCLPALQLGRADP